MFLSPESLPINWQEDPAPQETAEIGDDWLSENGSLALSIPSTIVFREKNYIVNVTHPKFETMFKTIKKLELSIDKRLI